MPLPLPARPPGDTAGEAASCPIEKAPACRLRRWAWGLASAGLVAAAAWLLYQRWGRQFDARAFGRSFASLDWRWLALAIAAALATYWGRALRWAVMLRPLRPRPSLWGLFSATAVGFASVVLIGRPAEVVRPYLIATRERVPFSSQLGAWVLERIADLLTILLVFGFALSQLGAGRPGIGPGLAWVLSVGGYVAAAMVAVLVLLLVLLGRSPAGVCRRLMDALGFLPEGYLKRIEGLLTAFMDGAGALRNWGSVSRFVGYTALEWLLITLCTLALVRAYPEMPRLGWVDILVFMGLASFGSLLQVPGIGGGVQVATVAVLREIHGVPIELASSVAVMMWIIAFVVIVPIGLPLALHEGLTWKKIRQLGAETRP